MISRVRWAVGSDSKVLSPPVFRLCHGSLVKWAERRWKSACAARAIGYFVEWVSSTIGIRRDSPSTRCLLKGGSMRTPCCLAVIGVLACSSGMLQASSELENITGSDQVPASGATEYGSCWFGLCSSSASPPAMNAPQVDALTQRLAELEGQVASLRGELNRPTTSEGCIARGFDLGFSFVLAMPHFNGAVALQNASGASFGFDCNRQVTPRIWPEIAQTQRRGPIIKTEPAANSHPQDTLPTRSCYGKTACFDPDDCRGARSG